MSNEDAVVEYNSAMDSALESLGKAAASLKQCGKFGTFHKAAMDSKMGLILALVDDEPLEIGVSAELLEKYGVI